MGMDAGSKPGAVRSDINITPLVDVCLVLLIIFMVVTPMLQKGQSAMLPQTDNPPKKAEDKNQILVVVTAEKNADRFRPGKIWIDKSDWTEAQFRDKIKEAFDRSPTSEVLVKGDARLSYGDVKNALLQVRDAGWKDVGLIVQKKQ